MATILLKRRKILQTTQPNESHSVIQAFKDIIHIFTLNTATQCFMADDWG